MSGMAGPVINAIGMIIKRVEKKIISNGIDLSVKNNLSESIKDLDINKSTFIKLFFICKYIKRQKKTPINRRFLIIKIL